MLVEDALCKAIHYYGNSQKNLTERIAVDPDKISYGPNRAKRIPFHYAIC